MDRTTSITLLLLLMIVAGCSKKEDAQLALLEQQIAAVDGVKYATVKSLPSKEADAKKVFRVFVGSAIAPKDNVFVVPHATMVKISKLVVDSLAQKLGDPSLPSRRCVVKSQNIYDSVGEPFYSSMELYFTDQASGNVSLSILINVVQNVTEGKSGAAGETNYDVLNK